MLSNFSHKQNLVDVITSRVGAGDENVDLTCVSGDKVQELFDQLVCYLPLVKIWYDWLSCQWELWSNCHQDIKDEMM